jgi:hypothetical protein
MRLGRVSSLAVVAACLVLVAPQVAPAREGLDLERLLRSAQSGRQYRPASPAELARCEELFLRTLSTPDLAGLADEWQQLGFRLLPLPATDPPLWVVFEPVEHARGWGAYVICPHRLPGLVLQAPHSYADRFTGNIALRLFAEGRFGAAAWNTVPRKLVDVCHTLDHPFSAFTRALVRAHPKSFVVQVHGFAQEKRQTVTGTAADLIVSNGTQAPDRSVRRLAILLQSELPFSQVHLYPTEVQELGATTNVQGETLRQAGSSRFVHLEMSEPLRLRMANDGQARQVLLKNLAEFVD